MSLLFGTSGDSYVNRTTNLPSTALLTWMGWINPTSVTAIDKIFMAIGTVTAGFNDYELFVSTATLAVWNGSAQANGSTLVAGVWRHVTVTINGTSGSNCKVYLDGVLNITGTARAVGSGTLRVGSNGATEPWLGKVAVPKTWKAILALDEIQADMRQGPPKRLADLNDYRPWRARGDIDDYSGNANPHTTTGTISGADDPPIAWPLRVRRPIVYAPSGLTGSVSESVSATDSSSATAIFGGTVSESGTAADASSATAKFPVSVSESGSAVDAQSAGVVLAPASVSESVSAVDTCDATVVSASVNSVSESVSATDACSATVIFAATVSESASAADTVSATAQLKGTVSESVLAVDTVSATALLVAVRAESVSAIDSIVATMLLQGNVVEVVSATDNPSATALLRGSVSEILAAIDSVSASGGHAIPSVVVCELVAPAVDVVLVDPAPLATFFDPTPTVVCFAPSIELALVDPAPASVLFDPSPGVVLAATAIGADIFAPS